MGKLEAQKKPKANKKQSSTKTALGNLENTSPNSPPSNNQHVKSAGSPKHHATFFGIASSSPPSNNALNNITKNYRLNHRHSITSYDYNPSEEDRAKIMDRRMNPGYDSEKAIKRSSVAEICAMAKRERYWPQADNKDIDERDFIILNGQPVKLFRFVITKENGLVCGSNDGDEGKSHEKVAKSKRIFAAGELGVSQAGQVVYANNKTGHYRVPPSTLTNVLYPYLTHILSSPYVNINDLYEEHYYQESNGESRPSKVPQQSVENSYIKALKKFLPKTQLDEDPHEYFQELNQGKALFANAHAFNSLSSFDFSEGEEEEEEELQHQLASNSANHRKTSTGNSLQHEAQDTQHNYSDFNRSISLFGGNYKAEDFFEPSIFLAKSSSQAEENFLCFTPS